MELEAVRVLISEAVDGLRLLDHPFYTRWAQGRLTVDDLAAYAGQYRHFECLLPSLLGQLRADVDDQDAAALVSLNLADEAEGDPTHLELFDRFAASVGANLDTVPGPAAGRLVDTYVVLAGDPAAALAALAAYEFQASEVARTKATGLRSFYGLDGAAVEFWDVHSQLEADHAEWACEAISYLATDADRVSTAARRAALAWWQFLDEREAALAG